MIDPSDLYPNPTLVLPKKGSVAFIATTGDVFRPVNRGSFGESPNYVDDFTDIDSSSDTEEILNSDSDEENKLLYLTKIGYSETEASIAIERCVPDLSIAELTDFICVAQMVKATDTFLLVEDMKSRGSLKKHLLNEDDHVVHLSNPMIGFEVPTETDQITQRTLPEDAIGPPYFYYENVALAPVCVWTEMSRYLYDLESEFVDSKYSCAAAWKRGYIHNVPIENRFPLIPLPNDSMMEITCLLFNNDCNCR
ncbi:zinc finger family protein [Hibiscus syriacus]|uniref:Zinc finger family protein n=1 Tax=Hibiscus syriacus TaxID=106335 RepID=A0A6A2YSK6_HIBSY|nr:zinc finger family protein [Hibiscus syriacus]